MKTVILAIVINLASTGLWIFGARWRQRWQDRRTAVTTQRKERLRELYRRLHEDEAFRRLQGRVAAVDVGKLEGETTRGLVSFLGSLVMISMYAPFASRWFVAVGSVPLIIQLTVAARSSFKLFEARQRMEAVLDIEAQRSETDLPALRATWD
jgi:hypothetical protein